MAAGTVGMLPVSYSSHRVGPLANLQVAELGQAGEERLFDLEQAVRLEVSGEWGGLGAAGG